VKTLFSASTASVAFVLMLSFLLSSGCQSSKNTQTTSSDPLMGERVPDKPFGVAGPTPPPQNRAGMATSPPQATASKSNAAMLVPGDPLIGAKPNAISDGTQPPKQGATGGWQAKDQDGSPSGGGSGPGVTLRTPEAVATPVTPVAPPGNIPNSTQGAGAMVQPVPVVNSSGSNVTTSPSSVQGASPVSPVAFSAPDPLQAALKARGVISQDQKTLPEGVRFTCRVANPQNPNFVRVYEATGPDYRTAVQAVLDQIDQER
jgi:hypothetical protein